MPNIPLLWVAALAVVPATTIAVYDDGAWRALGLAVLVVVIAVSMLDVLASRRRLAEIDCDVPALLRGTKGRELRIPVSFSNQGGTLGALRYGFSVSGDFRIQGSVVSEIAPMPGGKKRSIEYPIVPLKRGQFFLESLHVETGSRLGLWLLRRKFDLLVEVRVYPDLSAERKRLAGIFLMRGNEGSRLIRQVGKGRDFEQLRDYQPGDDYTDIDWKATARRQMPVTRTYQIEKTQEVYVIVDHSRLSSREIRVPVEAGTEGDWLYEESSAGGDHLVTTQLEKFLHCSLTLASVAERQGDLFGFISFADKVDRFIRGRNGKEHYNIVRDALYTLEPEPVAPDFEQLMIALRQRLTRRALLVMLVDLGDPLTSEQFFDALRLVNRQHLILVNMVRPEKAHPLFSSGTHPADAEEVYEHLAGHFQWQELRETGNRLHRLGVELSVPEHEELCTEAVSRYLEVKKRQIL
ncbi:MAG: DUF58 domain-containing protein [Verrucomicrobiales bacterium]